MSQFGLLAVSTAVGLLAVTGCSTTANQVATPSSAPSSPSAKPQGRPQATKTPNPAAARSTWNFVISNQTDTDLRVEVEADDHEPMCSYPDRPDTNSVLSSFPTTLAPKSPTNWGNAYGTIEFKLSNGPFTECFNNGFRYMWLTVKPTNSAEVLRTKIGADRGPLEAPSFNTEEQRNAVPAGQLYIAKKYVDPDNNDQVFAIKRK